MRIVLDRLPEQIECCECVPFFPSAVMGKGTQVQIVGAQVTRRPLADRRISATSNVGSITPATLIATLS